MSDLGPLDGVPRHMTFDLRFDYAVPPLSLNQRLHHHAKGRITRDVREATALIARRIPHLGRCDVTLTWYVTDKRKRDAENPVPTLKAMCDELVTLGVVKDDTPDFMTKHMPVILWIDKTVDVAHMVLTVTTVPAAEGVEIIRREGSVKWRSDCAQCLRQGKNAFAPDHEALTGCQSGGRNHCSCGWCF